MIVFQDKLFRAFSFDPGLAALRCLSLIKRRGAPWYQGTIRAACRDTSGIVDKETTTSLHKSCSGIPAKVSAHFHEAVLCEMILRFVRSHLTWLVCCHLTRVRITRCPECRHALLKARCVVSRGFVTWETEETTVTSPPYKAEVRLLYSVLWKYLA